MRRRIAIALLAGMCLAPLSVRAATGPASTYKVTVTQFEMFNGTSWVVVSNGSSTTMDIASVGAGQVAGNFFAGLAVPDGTYTQVRVTISRTFTIKGNVGAAYTTAAISNGGCATTAVAADAAECTVNAPVDPPANPDVLPTPLTVTNGVPSHKIRVSFNVSQAVQDGGPLGELYPAPADVTMTMIPL